jgi:hypothetical protein
MATSNNRLERVGIGFVLCFALLMFFSPLVSTRGALVGEVSAHGYNVRAKLSKLQSDLESSSTSASYGADAGAPNGTGTVRPARLERLDLPFSLRNPWLPSSLIFAAMACAGLALLGLLLFEKTTPILSFAGGCFGVFAILNVIAINSDLRSWIETRVNSGSLGPAANMSTGIRALMARAFQLYPGAGLYSLTCCLFLASVLSYSGAIPRISRIARREERVNLAQSIRIRPVNPHLPEETITTVDVSRGGLLFESAASHYYDGMEVYVRRKANSGDQATLEERGSVVRVEKLASDKCRVAVRIISPV